MSDQYGSRRILGSRLRTSSPQNSKWPRKKDIRNLYLFIIIRAPCDTTKQFLTLLQIPLHVKKWKFGQLSVNLGSESLQRLGVSMHPQYSPGWSRWVE